RRSREVFTFSLHDALPILAASARSAAAGSRSAVTRELIATMAAASAPATAAALPPPGDGAPLASASRNARTDCAPTSRPAGDGALATPGSMSIVILAQRV